MVDVEVSQGRVRVLDDLRKPVDQVEHCLSVILPSAIFFEVFQV
jgi:hypothetical protein